MLCIRVCSKTHVNVRFITCRNATNWTNTLHGVLTVDLLCHFRRPFIKRFALSYPTVVCLSCAVCPVCDVGVLWPNCWTDQDETRHAARSRPRPHCVTWASSSHTKRGTSSAPHLKFTGAGCALTFACTGIIRAPCLLWPNG